MARQSTSVLTLSTISTLLTIITRVTCLTTCPGFPGYCSESFPGQSCNVVCDFGRNNVPLCQEDGTWTDIPRCIEHDPGVDEQIPGTCPSIPGYCAQGFLNHRCTFDCVNGPDIDSLCSLDGTWEPYPTCQGDLRETRDGCDGCPGPAGGARNRTAEAILTRNTASDRRVPKIITNNGERKSVPSFAGNINIGRLEPQDTRFNQAARPRPVPTTTTTRPTFNSFQNNGRNQFGGQPRNQQQQPQFQQRQPQFQQQPQQSQPQFQQQPQQSQPQFQQQQPQFQPQSQFQQPLQRQPQSQPQPQQPVPNGVQGQSIFEQIKARINREKAAKKNILKNQQNTPPPQPQPSFRQPQPQPQPQQNFRQPQPSFQPQNNFGVFEAVDLSSGPNPSPVPAVPSRSFESRQAGNENFFGVFPEVNLQ